MTTKTAVSAATPTFTLPMQSRDVTITILNRIVGGIPQVPKLIEGWLKKNMENVVEEERVKLAETTLAEVGAKVEEEAQSMWTTFKRDEVGMYIEARQIKAAYKEAANILRDVLTKQEGQKAKSGKDRSRFSFLKSRVAERVWVRGANGGEKLYLRDQSGNALQSPTGNEERAIHVMTAQGPRTALKRYDFFGEGTRITFKLEWLDDGVVDAEVLNVLHQYMERNGIGADRSQGNGLFALSMT